MKTADFVQEKSEEIELSLSDAIRVTGAHARFFFHRLVENKVPHSTGKSSFSIFTCHFLGEHTPFSDPPM